MTTTKHQQPLIQFTDAAEQHIKAMITQCKQGIGFRLAIKETGCSGYQYVPEVIETINADDIYLKTPQGLDVYLDIKSVPLLQGVTVDFVEKNLGVKLLEYHNPNADDLCGCGESFTVNNK